VVVILGAVFVYPLLRPARKVVADETLTTSESRHVGD
jgi:hypothetical protein